MAVRRNVFLKVEQTSMNLKELIWKDRADSFQPKGHSEVVGSKDGQMTSLF